MIDRKHIERKITSIEQELNQRGKGREYLLQTAVPSLYHVVGDLEELRFVGDWEVEGHGVMQECPLDLTLLKTVAEDLCIAGWRLPEPEMRDILARSVERARFVLSCM